MHIDDLAKPLYRTCDRELAVLEGQPSILQAVQRGLSMPSI